MADLLARHGAAAEVVPIYTYKCKSCDGTQDIHHGFDENFDDPCDCGGERRRVLQLSGVAFKGTGFYRTDNQTHAVQDS